MKKSILLLVIPVFFFGSCDLMGPQIEENGLTRDINNLVPQEILDEMDALGLPVYTGENPPDIGLGSTGTTFYASPFVLLSSNRSSDTPGYTFADYYVRFYNQKNSNLTVSVDYSNGGETGNGIGAYIVGENNNFSVFVEIDSEYKSSKAKMVHVISGTMSKAGIVDLYFANFMLDNYGNASGYWIANGDGRVIYDSDGLSEVTTGIFNAPRLNVKGISGLTISTAK